MNRKCLNRNSWILCAIFVLSFVPSLLAQSDISGQAGIVILGPALAQAPPTPTGAAIVVSPGRFLPITPADGSPSYIAPSVGYRVYRIPAGGSFVGVKFDASPNAEPEIYSWPETKTPIYVLLARSTAGQYTVQLVKNGSVESGPIENGPSMTMQVGQLPQPPPGPTPNPPGPTPGPVPIPGPGNRVLIVYETGDLANLPSSQVAALHSVPLRDYMRSKVIDYRVYDQNVNTSGEIPIWKNGMERAKQKIAEWKPTLDAQGKVVGPARPVPWLIISCEARGTSYEGPFLETTEKNLALIKQITGG